MSEEKKKTLYADELLNDPETAGKLTPMMIHYLQTKQSYPNCILMYRLGDFYEMFFDDAETVSRELDLTLTGKSCGLENRAPMCGIPFHAVDSYVNRLIKAGYKVAICEQLEDPKEAKGMVKRGVNRVITPGTNIDSTALDESKNNFLFSIFYAGGAFGIAFCDVSTGDFFVSRAADYGELLNQLEANSPSEIIVNDSFFMSSFPDSAYTSRTGVAFQGLDNIAFDPDNALRTVEKQFSVKDPEALGLTADDLAIPAAGALLDYLHETQMIELAQITTVKRYAGAAYMVLDASTRRNLELTETMREKRKYGSLLWVLDHTRTAMGARMLRREIEQPLVKKDTIEERLNAVEELKDNMVLREELREYLAAVYDLERLLTRVAYRSANPRDMIALKGSLSVLPAIQAVLSDARAEALVRIRSGIDTLSDVKELLEKAIVDDPPAVIHDGGIIKAGFSEEVDRLKSAKTDGKKWLSDLEEKEREKTGITKLKVKYNKVFGYYIEVSNSFRSQVPDYFIRKQTLVNAERYYTPELKELENTILGSEERLLSLEREIYSNVLDQTANEIKRIQATAGYIAELDFYQSLAYTADRNRYIRPALNTDGKIDIKGGRHPVIEKLRQEELFIENDTYLDSDAHRIAIITGPNMAGKSTYMRQTALIVLMAQIGSFVPASSANIGICDRVFTRVGASDDLGSGQSTFMVEMNEVANILKNATENSLLILDEIGRGTSTYDGLSIAWAVVEYIADRKKIGAKTLFATHYHELTELEGQVDGVNNYCVAVRENGDDIVFLRKIVKGGADKSYGIAVARLAGLPAEVLERADEIANELSASDISKEHAEIHPAPAAPEPVFTQMSLFDNEPQVSGLTASEKKIMETLRSLNINDMTPMTAMNRLNSLIKLAGKDI